MQRQSCGVGCIIFGLGALVSGCLLPYLISSIYSVVTVLLQVPTGPNWLWGDMIHAVFGESEFLYMLLAEGPICCVGALGLVIIILGLVMGISSMGQSQATTYVEEEEAYYYPPEEEWR
jgi:hypothetical protein